MFDPKKTASVILKGMTPPKDTSGDPAGEPESDADMGLHSAAEDMISAIHNRDAKGFHAAMQNYMTQGNASDNDDEDEDD